MWATDIQVLAEANEFLPVLDPSEGSRAAGELRQGYQNRDKRQGKVKKIRTVLDAIK